MRHVVAAFLITLLTGAALFACGQQEESTQRETTPPATSGQTEETTAEETTLSEPTSSESTVAEPDSNSSDSSGDPAEATVEATSGAGDEEPSEVPDSGEEPPFTAEPEAGGGEVGAAESLDEVRFGVHEGYERVVLDFVDFGSGGGAATGVPQWNLSSPVGEGYARVSLPDLGSTNVSDGVFGDGVLGDFYVVRAPESSGGGFFVDIFVTTGFQYRTQELSDPGRLAVDFLPVNVALEYPLPERGESNVVMGPRSGDRISSPLTVSGYSRNFEGSTTVQLIDSSGAVVAESVVQANDWAETWGYFEEELEFPRFTGAATVRVGAPSPRDGSFEGVDVPVTTGG